MLLKVAPPVQGFTPAYENETEQFPLVVELSVCEPGPSHLPFFHSCHLFASESLAYPFLLLLFFLLFGFGYCFFTAMGRVVDEGP